MRVHLSRIIAYNWYGYRRIIELSGLSLITGANGSGKSALLDLLQFVLLGEQHSRFNKAAAGAGSGRTLRGYCLCDTNTLGKDGQERYLRPSGVTLAALEFSWPGDEPRRETWGARIEYEGPTAKPRTLWFTVPSRLEGDDFLTKDLIGESLQFLTEDEFRVHVKREMGGEVFDRQTTYLEEMGSRAHLGFDRKQMNKTLPNSMAFQPVESFEKFIRDYLLEQALPDVATVRSSVDAHRRAQERLEKMRDQHERLSRVGERHQAWLEARRESALFRHLRDALSHEERLEKLNACRAELERLRSEHAGQRSDHEAALSERNELESQLREVRLVAGNDSQIAALANQRGRRDEVERELDSLRDAAKTAREYLHDRVSNWKQWLKMAAELELEPPAEAEAWLETMRGTNEAAGLDTAEKMPRIYHALHNDAAEQLRPVRDRLHELEARELRLRRELDDLEHKGSAHASPLLDALKSRGQKAEALGRVIEVKPAAEDWWPLLESLLGNHRQAVLAEDYKAAWEQAHKLGHSDEPIVNSDELTADGKPAKGSVAAFFDTRNPLAARFLQQHYGDLVAVDKSNKLDAHPRAFSKDGWLKDPPLRVRLQPAKDLTIGEEGRRRLRARLEEDLAALEEEIAGLRRQQEAWNTFLHRGTHWELDKATRPEGTTRLHKLPDLRRELQQLEETIRLLATPEREKIVEELRVLEKTFQGVVERIGRLANAMERASQRERELGDNEEHFAAEEERFKIERQRSRESLEGFRDAEISERLAACVGEFPTWAKRIEAAALVAQTQLHDADKARAERQRERFALAEAHPETADAFDPEDDDNTRYEVRRRELEEHDLDRYTREADDARREWEDRLQHQVLDVLKEKLDEADRTKRELNKAMDHEIGGWRYQLSMRKDLSHTAIWALVDKGLSPGLELLATGAKEEIEKAKAALMAAIENPEEPRNQRALDYRFYHHWDIQAHPVGQGEGAAVSLNKSAKKQSGGENQAPFFVAMLAAFQRVYDLGDRHPKPNLGVIIMDEAFSKLSGDRIDACLALARNFGLQLVMAFPEDRLPTMIGHAETVLQCRVERSYDGSRNGAVADIENWVVKVDRDRLAEALG
ncbi:SbcC/MukB-like Walker B domain-containing protein [Luteolibacter marinus]|uniref:SbcC/MukB-like Walker B domain-containing protein n=1 Tax=Luteolibacter marinus TaxID=2776705 RepID=UPI001868B925|nr:SbcC/MukB-like Walker B domain-containing protein [Luteolibacter marinus]